MEKFKPGDHAFILESNRIVREVTVVRCIMAQLSRQKFNIFIMN